MQQILYFDFSYEAFINYNYLILQLKVLFNNALSITTSNRKIFLFMSNAFENRIFGKETEDIEDYILIHYNKGNVLKVNIMNLEILLPEHFFNEEKHE